MTINEQVARIEGWVLREHCGGDYWEHPAHMAIYPLDENKVPPYETAPNLWGPLIIKHDVEVTLPHRQWTSNTFYCKSLHAPKHSKWQIGELGTAVCLAVIEAA